MNDFIHNFILRLKINICDIGKNHIINVIRNPTHINCRICKIHNERFIHNFSRVRTDKGIPEYHIGKKMTKLNLDNFLRFGFKLNGASSFTNCLIFKLPLHDIQDILIGFCIKLDIIQNFRHIDNTSTILFQKCI